MHKKQKTFERELNCLLADRAVKKNSGEVANFPVHVYLQLTSGCNIDCFMCSEHLRPEGERRGRGLRSLKPELFDRIERMVLPCASELTFGVGGEPTLATHFIDYARRAADTGLMLHLVTNGSRLAVPEVAEIVGRRFTSVNVSVDAATAETHESIRTGSSWSRLLRGLEDLAAHRRHSSPEARTRVTLSMVLMRRNVHELPMLVELAARLELDAVHAQHVIAITPDAAIEQLSLDPERYDRALAEAREAAARLGVELSAPPPFAEVSAGVGGPSPARTRRVRGPIPCRLPSVSVNILVDGEVAPCCHPLGHQRMKFGNIEQDDFEALWFGRLAAGLRRGLADGSAPDICHACTIGPMGDFRPSEMGPLDPDWTLEAHLAGSSTPASTPMAQLERSGTLDLMRDLVADRVAIRSERDGLGAHLVNVEAHVANVEAQLESAQVHLRRVEAQLEVAAASADASSRDKESMRADALSREAELDELRRRLEARDVEVWEVKEQLAQFSGVRGALRTMKAWFGLRRARRQLPERA